MNNTNAKTIADHIGKFLKTDLQATAQKWKRAMRIKLEIDISKPLQDVITLQCQGRSNLLAEIRYERLVEFGFFCGHLGHKVQTCKSISLSENMDAKAHRFGPWLKTENPLTPNPFIDTKIPTIIHPMVFEIMHPSPPKHLLSHNPPTTVENSQATVENSQATVPIHLTAETSNFEAQKSNLILPKELSTQIKPLNMTWQHNDREKKPFSSS